mmetsp:Transcript_9853/g.24383  ORF Transcript_9853/g.24383 Transcript_9853/m.24383 type:complete len:297 (+) Transcript_9853:2065-2955(+)
MSCLNSSRYREGGGGAGATTGVARGVARGEVGTEEEELRSRYCWISWPTPGSSPSMRSMFSADGSRGIPLRRELTAASSRCLAISLLALTRLAAQYAKKHSRAARQAARSRCSRNQPVMRCLTTRRSCCTEKAERRSSAASQSELAHAAMSPPAPGGDGLALPVKACRSHRGSVGVGRASHVEGRRWLPSPPSSRRCVGSSRPSIGSIGSSGCIPRRTGGEWLCEGSCASSEPIAASCPISTRPSAWSGAATARLCSGATGSKSTTGTETSRRSPDAGRRGTNSSCIFSPLVRSTW